MRELTNITHVKCSEQYSKHIIDINHYHREHTVLQICTNIFSPPSHQTHSSSLFQKDPLGLLIGIHLAGLIKPSLQNFDNIYITSFQMSYLYMYVYYTHICVCVCVCVRARSVTQLCLTLCDPLAPLFLGFSRQEYWSRLPCPPLGDCPNPGIEPLSLMFPALAGRFFTTSAAYICIFI